MVVVVVVVVIVVVIAIVKMMVVAPRPWFVVTVCGLFTGLKSSQDFVWASLDFK